MPYGLHQNHRTRSCPHKTALFYKKNWRCEQLNLRIFRKQVALFGFFHFFWGVISKNTYKTGWNEYSNFIRQRFGERVQKISVNTGLGCPNLDGTLSWDGCTYCNNSSFSPFYCKADKSVSQQLSEGIAFFSGKYKAQKYLAYFQSFTNTYTSDLHFEGLLQEALSVPSVTGLVIATRPDSITDKQISLLNELGKTYYISLEFGIESSLDRSLARINRGHDQKSIINAFERCKNKNFYTGAHLILGLPGESREDMLSHSDFINNLAPDNVKLHQLQILKGTEIAKEFKQVPHDFVYFTVDDYIELVIEFIERSSPDIVFERFTSESPKEMIISPDWNGMKNFEFVNRLRNEMKNRNSYQGKQYKNKNND